MNLEKELDNLNIVLLKMVDVVKKNIVTAFDVYEHKKELTSINDDIVDQYERLIEEICLDILVRERPVAGDLKQVSGILKLISDLERIGDHAEDIMGFNVKLLKCHQTHNSLIDEMLTIVINMIDKAIESFVEKSIEKANFVIKTDDKVDILYDEIIDSIISEKSFDNENIQFAIYTTLVVKYIERIGDHAVNIAEWVIYMINGIHKDKKIY